MQMQATRNKKQFVSTCGLLNHEPLLLVRRPKSDPVSDSNFKNNNSIPGFMKPLKSKTVRPSSHKTIDVFTVTPVKKRNLWENAGEETKLRFTSTVRPCAKLSDTELINLKNGYTATKPSVSFDSSSDEKWTVVSNLSTKQTQIESLSDSESDGCPSTPSSSVSDTDGEALKVSSEVEKQKDSDTDHITSELLRSSSFITEMQAEEKRATKADNSINIINDEIEDPEIINCDSLTSDRRPSAIRTEYERISEVSDKSEATKTDTRSIPFQLPSVNIELQQAQNTTSKLKAVKDANVHRQSPGVNPATVTEEKLHIEQKSTDTKVDLSNINVLKGSIFFSAAKRRPHSFPTRKKETVSKQPTDKVKDDVQARRSTAKSVTFAEN